MSNQRRPISAHFARLSLNPNSRLVVTNKNNNNYNNKPFTSQPKSNKWELGGNGNKLRYVGCEQSDFAPTMKVTSLQPSARSKPKANKNKHRNIQRQRPQTSNGILSKRRNSRITNNYNSAKMPQTDSNSRLLIYHHHILNNNNNKNKIKNYKNINASYSSSNVLHRTSAKNNNNNNKDSVIFAIDPKHPLCPIVFRDEKAKMISRERLNLDNRNLNKCPILRGEENLRLLNYENNIICKISNLNNLQILIFLDLYNNRISKIENLDCVPLLRVLMLGRNEISKIENLDNLHCLDVLDLHSNKISKMENLNHLKELRVLNLAGNNISNVENISNLKKLVEINVRRNIIINIKNSFISHQKLQRILLSNNNITDIKTILCLTFAKSIQQLTIDNNPFYDKFTQNTLQNIHSNPLNIKIISMFKSLKQLNNFEISKNIRDHLLVTQNNNIKSIINSDGDEDQLLAQNNNLKENIQTENVADISDDDGNHIENDNDNELSEEELISKIGEEWMDDKNRKDGLKYHKLVTNNILKMYGCGFINNFNYDVIEEMHFYYIDFNELTKYFHYFKTLKSMNVLKFNHNNIHSLYQIDALSVLSNIKNVSFGLNNLSNKIVETSPNLYKMYCIFRLPNIIFIDNKKVTIKEKEIANTQFYYLREEWKNNKILLIKGFCAPSLNQASNINENNDKDLHQIFESFPNVNNNKDNNDIDVDCDEKRELNNQKNMAKESIQHAINIYKSRQRIKALWPSIVADYIHEVINDLQMNSI